MSISLIPYTSGTRLLWHDMIAMFRGIKMILKGKGCELHITSVSYTSGLLKYANPAKYDAM